MHKYDATEPSTQVDQSVAQQLHQTLTAAMELAVRVQRFHSSMLGGPPTDGSDGPKNVVPARPVLEELRDRAIRVDAQINEANYALSTLEKELN